MPTTSTNLSMPVPVVGSDADAWGGYLNTALTIIDGIFVTNGSGTSVGLNVGSGKTLNVTGTATINSTSSTINGAVIGGTTPAAGTFTTLTGTTSVLGAASATTLTVSGAATLNGTGNKLTVSGTGSTFVAAPASAGTLDNVAIGATTPAAVTASTFKATVVRETKVAIGASDIDVSSANVFSKTIAGTTTFTVSNVPSAGTVASFLLDLTNGGAFTVNWWSGVKWASGVAPTLTASGRDVLGFFTHDGGTVWNGFVLGKAMA